MRKRTQTIAVAVLAGALLLAGCGGEQCIRRAGNADCLAAGAAAATGPTRSATAATAPSSSPTPSTCVPSEENARWAPDPDDHSRDRWWDGCKFTGKTRKGTDRSTQTTERVPADVCASAPPTADNYPTIGVEDLDNLVTYEWDRSVGDGVTVRVASADASRSPQAPGYQAWISATADPDELGYPVWVCGPDLDRFYAARVHGVILGTVEFGAIPYGGDGFASLPALWVTSILSSTGTGSAGSGADGTQSSPPGQDRWADYTKLSDRDWAKIAKNPDAHSGDSVVVYGVVTQFDAATGPDGFRADVSGTRQDSAYQYDTNTLMYGTVQVLAGLVEGDEFRAWVTVEGAETYDTTVGGRVTAPVLDVDRIERV